MHPLAKMLGFSTKSSVSQPYNAASLTAQNTLFNFLHSAEIHPRQAWELYKSVGTYAKVVDIIADNVASLGIKININGELIDDSDVHTILEFPGYNRTRRRLIKELSVQMLVTGTAYPMLIGNAKHLPHGIDVLEARHLNVIEGQDGWPDALQFHEPRRALNFSRTEGIDFQYLNGEFAEILSIYDNAGSCKGIGLSRLQAVRNDVELKLQGLMHNRSLLGKGARLSGILSFKSALGGDAKRDITKQMSRQIAGTENAGGILVTGGGEADFKNMMMTPRDMDWQGLVKVVDEAIVARYNVPTTLFSVDAQTHNNYATAWHMLYDNAVLPTFQIVYGHLARALSQRLGKWIEIRHDELSSTILADKSADRAKGLLESRIITPNEAREMVGYEPMVGADAIYDLPGLVPTYQDVFADHLNDASDGDADSSNGKDKPNLRVVN